MYSLKTRAKIDITALCLVSFAGFYFIANVIVMGVTGGKFLCREYILNMNFIGLSFLILWYLIVLGFWLLMIPEIISSVEDTYKKKVEKERREH